VFATATVAEASTGLVHAVLNEPSTGLYFIHKYSSTAAVLKLRVSAACVCRST
jgi:hypothetical protein